MSWGPVLLEYSRMLAHLFGNTTILGPACNQGRESLILESALQCYGLEARTGRFMIKVFGY